MHVARLMRMLRLHGHARADVWQAVLSRATERQRGRFRAWAIQRAVGLHAAGRPNGAASLFAWAVK